MYIGLRVKYTFLSDFNWIFSTDFREIPKYFSWTHVKQLPKNPSLYVIPPVFKTP